MLARLGSGGMGVVYRAHDRERGVDVALKALHQLSADAVLRFKNEFRTLTDLAHPNLVTLSELFSDDGLWFFTMELVEGVSLLSWVRHLEESATTRDHAPDSADSAERLGVAQTGAVRAATRAQPADEVRLRAGLSQLAHGLAALHAAGKVHRDIKPSNVLVTPEGRVVLLDFGLAADSAHKPSGDSQQHVVGTVDYMAPEQAASQRVSPAADWYALGVILFEGLTGRLPFMGRSLEVLLAKTQKDAPTVRALAPMAPPDLAELCDRLLARAPEARPAEGEILARLGAAAGVATAARRGDARAETPFVGRARELAMLDEAWGGARQGVGTCVLIEGESGVGKTALVRRFTDLAQARERKAVVLTGRCYERESVPFKAFDGIVDALTSFLVKLPAPEVTALLPRRAALLGQVFPVLRRVEAVAKAPLQASTPADPGEQRMRVYVALRELFARLAERRPVIVVIDDLQWADPDSLALLVEVLRPPDAPALLLLGLLRGAFENEPEARPSQGSVAITDLATRLGGAVQRLQVASLEATDALALASQLLAEGGASSPALIAREAGGHPLFIDELVRHALAGAAEGESAHTGLKLDDALWGRIERLEATPRAILELVVIAGGPMSQQTIAHAAGLDFGELSRCVATLRAGNLVRTQGSRQSDRIESYHDRVRAAVQSRLQGEARRLRHERLALALEAATDADPETLAAHWRGAGEGQKAAQHAVRAAGQAMEALAFERAARMYALAMELGGDSSPEDHLEHQIAMADALANSGRGQQAASAYLAAASDRHRATPHQALELRRLAADQLLRSGHFDEGTEVLSTVLATVGMRLAATPSRALLSLALRRLRVRLRGLRFRERDASQIPAETLTRIDICWSAALGLSLVDTLRGADFQSENLLRSLRAGEPYRVARALAMEAGFAAAGGLVTRKRTLRLTKLASELAARIANPHATGLVAMISAIAETALGNWKAGRQRAEEATAILRERCTNVTWELSSVELFHLWSLSFMGEFGELSRRLPTSLHEAELRGDLFAVTQLKTGPSNQLWLAQDQPELAWRHATEAMAGWSSRGFHLQHWYDVIAVVHHHLYVGQHAAAHEYISTRWRALARSQLLHIQRTRVYAHHLMGATALAAATSPDIAASARPALLATAHRAARRTAAEQVPWARALGELTLAGVAAARGQRPEAIELLGRALVGFQRTDMGLHAASAGQRLIELKPTEAPRISAEIAAWMADQKVQNPARLIAMAAPGFVVPGLLEPAR